MRFLVFLLFSWCPPGLAVKSLASLGLIRSGSKLAAFQKYTDNVVARFLKSGSSAVTSDQYTAMQTVKEYLKNMIWGDEGVWQWHLHDVGLTNTHADDCLVEFSNVKHVSLICVEGTDSKQCQCNLEMGNLGRKDSWLRAGEYRGRGLVEDSTLNAHNSAKNSILSTDVKGQLDGTHSTLNTHQYTDRSTLTLDTTDRSSSTWSGHNIGLSVDANGADTTITNNQVFVSGQEVECSDMLDDKLSNMRELRMLAELSYRRMHVCHNEKGQEFWLAGSDKNRKILTLPDRRPQSAPATTGPGFCGLYKQYRRQTIEGKTSLWGDDSTITDTMTINGAAYLHSFPSCARKDGIQLMAGTSNRHGVLLHRSWSDNNPLWAQNGISSSGDKRCVAWSTAEQGTDPSNQEVVTRYKKGKFVEIQEGDNSPPQPETIVPRTCEMYNDDLIATASSLYTGGETDVQCDTWFRDCTISVVDETLKDSIYDKDLDAQHEDSTSKDDVYWYNETAHTFNGCTQRKPLKSPLLQSCSYTANYNNYPPFGSTQDSRGYSSAMYLDDTYIKTDIVTVREDMETCLEEVRAWFDPMWTHYSLCRRGEEIGTDQELCQQEVRQWEDAVCIFQGRQEEICGYIDQCLNESVSKCSEDTEAIDRRIISRKLDYESTQRIECLLDAVTNLDEGCVCFGLCDNSQKSASYNPTSYAAGFDRNMKDNACVDADCVAVYTFPTDGEDDDVTNDNQNIVPTAAFDAILKGPVCQKQYAAQRKHMLDNVCMISSDRCQMGHADWAGTGACPGGWLQDKATTTDLTGVAGTESSETDAAGFGTNGTSDIYGNSSTHTAFDGEPSLRWMRSDFRFPIKFVKPDGTGVVTTKCDDLYGMYACVNADFDGSVVLAASGLPSSNPDYTTSVVRDRVNAQHETLRTNYPRNVKEYVVGGVKMVRSSTSVTYHADQSAAPHTGQIPLAGEWKASGTLPSCGEPQALKPVCQKYLGSVWAMCAGATFKKWGVGPEGEDQALGNCLHSYSQGANQDSQCPEVTLVEDTTMDAGSQVSIQACPAGNGKIHLDVGIWNIKAGCSSTSTGRCCNPDEINLVPCTSGCTGNTCEMCAGTPKDGFNCRVGPGCLMVPGIPALWECPQFNKCNTHRVTDYPKSVECFKSDNCEKELNIDARLFWQVPSKDRIDTGTAPSGECQDDWGTISNNECDASFQRIYYALQTSASGTECTDVSTSQSMPSHYLKDQEGWKTSSGQYTKPPDSVKYTTDYDHLGCKLGAESNQYWKGLEGQTLSTFGDSSLGQAEGAGRCTQWHGGPTDDEKGAIGYGTRLAGWLQFPSSSTNAGKHCFQTDPCPQDKSLVSFHTVYPFVTCPEGQHCNAGYYEDGTDIKGKYSGTDNNACGTNGDAPCDSIRPYNPPDITNTYCS